jgi:cyclic pyranopterin phosphate synthase
MPAVLLNRTGLCPLFQNHSEFVVASTLRPIIMLTDQYSRTFKTLRVSLTNSCNLSCNYCTDQSEYTARTKQAILSVSDYIKLINNLHKNLNLTTVRLTGGEPLLYKQVCHLIEGIKALGIPEIKMTTNGVFLKEKAVAIKNAGISSINVSLDSLDQKTFYKISGRKNLNIILDGIDHALAIGIPVKLNTVVMKGINTDQVLPLLAFARERNIPVRFLEVMKMGHLYNRYHDLYYSQEEILEKIAEQHRFIPLDRARGATASYWITDQKQIFGIIANESHPFCLDCNRLRLDSFGNIYGCLSSDSGISIKEHSDDPYSMQKLLQQALAQKQSAQFTGSALSMKYIGG